MVISLFIVMNVFWVVFDELMFEIYNKLKYYRYMLLLNWLKRFVKIIKWECGVWIYLWIISNFSSVEFEW